MISRGKLLFAAALGLPLAALSQNRPIAVAVPSDPLELVGGTVETLDTPAAKQAATKLLTRARISYDVRNGPLGYRLKASFTVDSGGRTQYDGVWEMEEMFLPQLGRRWTAKTAAGYTTTQITADNVEFGEGTATTLPLRLQEARAGLFNPMPSNPNPDAIRVASGTYRGLAVTCYLIAGPEPVPVVSGRRWDETEECIDPQSGLLQVHSQVPGRYYAYDYTGALSLGSHVLPGKMTVTESGKTVAEIHVDSLEELSDADPKLFAATKEMTWAVNTGSAQKLVVFPQKGAARAAAIQPVCVYGLITSDGKLVEAHSLQTSDPNSQAAIDYAKSMTFFNPAAAAGRPEQHLVFIVEKFPAARQ